MALIERVISSLNGGVSEGLGTGINHYCWYPSCFCVCCGFIALPCSEGKCRNLSPGNLTREARRSITTGQVGLCRRRDTLDALSRCDSCRSCWLVFFLTDGIEPSLTFDACFSLKFSLPQTIKHFMIITIYGRV